jgi:hypothetical protein
MKRLLPLVFLVCCGGPRAFIDIEVQSNLVIPDEADAMDLRLLRADEQTVIEERTFALDPARPFPIHIILEPDSDAPHDIRIHLVATLAGTPVASAGIAHAWQDDHINDVTMTLDDL